MARPWGPIELKERKKYSATNKFPISIKASSANPILCMLFPPIIETLRLVAPESSQ
jgi:hypothetical protein